MTTNDAARPVAYWVPNGRATQDGSYEDGPGYLVDADDASESEKTHGSPLYPASEIDRLTGEVSRLQKSLDQLTGMKFSDRMHAALVSRAEVAEEELTKFRKDAGRWHFFLLCFDRPMEREWLRRGFNLPQCDFTPDISSLVDAAMRHNLRPWQCRLYGMTAEELTQPESDHG